MTPMLDLAPLLKGDYLAAIVSGIETTLMLAGAGCLLSTFLAVVLLLLRLAEHRALEAVIAAFISYHRNVPFLVQLMLWYFGIPTLLPDDAQAWLTAHHSDILLAIVALGLYLSAYFCEDLRAGLRAVPRGQIEAARALGLGYLRMMAYVVLPQSVRNAMPSLINNAVMLFKSTSLAMTIGVAELTFVSQEIENATYKAFAAYSISTALYLTGSLLMMATGALATRYIRKEAKR